MPFSEAFHEILNKRNMTVASLAERTEIPGQLIEAALYGQDDLTDDQVSDIAAALGVPPRALYANTQLPLSSIPDFRRKAPRPALMEAGVVAAVGFVEKISLSLASLGLNLAASEEVQQYDGPLTKRSAKKLAHEWRGKWGVSPKQQLEWQDANKVYVSFREFVERLGIFVLHYSFGTDGVAGLYAKVDGGPHTILVNTTSSSKARKLFTLAHEFCHVLLRADGISNPSVLNNKIEVFCNQFAAYLIAPDDLIELGMQRYDYAVSIDNDSIRLFAKNLGISQQSCVLRLIDTGYLDEGEYGKWISRFKGPIPDGDMGDGGGGGDGDAIRNKRTQYGLSFLSKLAEAKKEGILDAIEIYRMAGIKPKYQNALFGG